MTDRELMQQALSVLCNNVQPREGVRDNRHLTPKSHVEIHQQTIDALRGRVEQPERPWVGLTEPERLACYDLNPARFASAIETKLKEKNA